MTTYNIYQRETLEQQPAQIATGLNTNSHSVSGLTKGKEYLFSVGAVKNGIEKVSEEKAILFGEAWTPAHMTTAKTLWLDSDSFIISNGLITQWLDKTGNNHHFNPGSESTRPAHSSLNNHNIAVLDGVDDFLNGATTKQIFKNMGRGWMFMLSKRISGANVITHNAGLTNRVNLRFGRGATFGSARLDAGTIVNPPGTGTLNSEWGLAVCEADWQGGRLYLSLDGGERVSSAAFAAGLTSNTDSADGTTIGRFHPTNATVANCEVACVIMGNNALPSQTEIDKLMGWAAHKWGFTDKLPIGHPYKTLIPTV